MAPPLFFTFLGSCLSLASCPLTLQSLLPSLHVALAGPYVYGVSFSLPFSASATLLCLLLSCSPSLPIPFPSLLSPHGHGRPLLLYSLLLSAFLCLCYSVNSPPHALNKLYSILYYTGVCLVPQMEGMPWHGPAEAPPSPTPHQNIFL